MQDSVLKIGDIRLLCRQHFEQTGDKLSFIHAYRMAAARQRHAFPMQLRIPEDSILSVKDFTAFIDSIPVDCSEPATHSAPDQTEANFHIEENDVIRQTDDLTSYIHIPFVNDGFHTHDHFEINYVYSGSALFQFMGGEYRELRLTSGDVCFLAPEAPHNFMADPDSLVISVMIRKTTFDSVFSFLMKRDSLLTAFFRENLYKKQAMGFLIFSTGTSWQVQRWMQMLLGEARCRDLCSNGNSICITALFFNYLHRHCQKYYTGSGASTAENPELCCLVLLEYIRQNYASVSLAELSRTFHYSPSFLSKMIHRQTGISFGEFVQKQKLEHGETLLKTTGYTLQEICEIIGYDSCAHFSRTFKKRYGLSPSEFRKQRQKAADAPSETRI